jgi:hypothetical protein
VAFALTLKERAMTYKYHKDGTKPVNGEIFVFGSNLIGIHGAGAAKEAVQSYGAQWGSPIGLVGQSYAIPTKDRYIATMPIEEIEPFVTRFLDFAHSAPDKEFFVTRIGCGLAGYEDFQIAPLFKRAPENCNFPKEWEPYLK